VTAALLIGSLGDLASMAGMPSEPTLRKLIAEHDDFPILSRGTNGKSYEIDLAAAHLFVRRIEEREAEERRRHREMVGQLSMELLGEDSLGGASAVVDLTPAERVQLMQEELLRIKVAQQRGELVKAGEVEAHLAEVLVAFRENGRGFSGKCAKRLTFSREQMAVIDSVMNAMLKDLADRMERLKDRVAPASAGEEAAAAAAV